MKLKSVTIAILLLLCAAAAQAEVAISATHRVVNITGDGISTQVTINLTLVNNGEAVDTLSLVAHESCLMTAENSTVEVGALATGETRAVSWATDSNCVAEYFSDPRMLAFQGNASTTSGEQSFPVVSNEEVQ